jgi:Flp pilus assembly protein TadG
MQPPGRRFQRGAAAVEFALVLIPLLLILLGTIDWGWYFYVREVVANAAREGARHGAAYGSSGGASAAQSRANAYLQSLGLNQVATASTTTCSTGAPTANSCVRVTIDYAITPDGGSISGFLQSVMPATARAAATMEYEQ